MDLFEDNIFKNNVLYMKSLIGKTVKVETVDGQFFNGIVYVIDPIYKTLVLHICPKKQDPVFILHQAIKSLEVISDVVEHSYLERKALTTDDIEEAASEKLRLKKWLQQMYISVDEVGEYLKIDDHLLIMPPYGLDNCICNNVIILEKIRNIMSLMPKDFR